MLSRRERELAEGSARAGKLLGGGMLLLVGDRDGALLPACGVGKWSADSLILAGEMVAVRSTLLRVSAAGRGMGPVDCEMRLLTTGLNVLIAAATPEAEDDPAA